MYDDLDLVPVEEELVGVTSDEFKSCERSTAAFERDKRWRQPGRRIKNGMNVIENRNMPISCCDLNSSSFTHFSLFQRGQRSR